MFLLLITNMKKIILALLATALFAGCSNQKFHFNDTNSAFMPNMETSQPFFVGGIVQESHVDVAKICGSAAKVARVETIQAPVDCVLSVLTFGIYSPRTAKVYCTK